MITTTVNDLAAEALFVSDLQPSQCASVDMLQQAVTAMILLHGTDGCAMVVAGEFGDHPETAVRRMTWARAVLAATPAVITQAVVPACAARQRPELVR